jgi:hypothetical protein
MVSIYAWPCVRCSTEYQYGTAKLLLEYCPRSADKTNEAVVDMRVKVKTQRPGSRGSRIL